MYINRKKLLPAECRAHVRSTGTPICRSRGQVSSATESSPHAMTCVSRPKAPQNDLLKIIKNRSAQVSLCTAEERSIARAAGLPDNAAIELRDTGLEAS